MQERNLIEQLFEKRDMHEYFDFNNEELKGISKIMEATENKISNLLKRVHPKTRRKIGYQFDKYQQKSFRYYEKERGLVYESGFIDGINLMLLVMGKK